MNCKPAVEFDERYGTSISQEWKFPFDHSADDVWKNIQGKDYRGTSRFGLYLDALTVDHFPYEHLDKLDYDQKCDILMGMCSGFNIDDILYFSVDKIYAYKNKHVSDELDSMGLIQEWVVSEKTLVKIKAQLKEKRI